MKKVTVYLFHRPTGDLRDHKEPDEWKPQAEQLSVDSPILQYYTIRDSDTAFWWVMENNIKMLL